MADYGEHAAIIYELFGPDTLSEGELAEVRAREQAAEQQRNQLFKSIQKLKKEASL